MHSKRNSKNGQIIILFAVCVVLLMGAAGMAMDLIYAYVVSARLRTAVDAAAFTAVRGDENALDATAQNTFNANFPSGHLNTLSSSLAPLDVSGDDVTCSGTASLPTYFLRFFGYSNLNVGARAIIRRDGTGIPVALVIDEDTIDNGLPGIEQISFSAPLCGGGDPSVCVNDDIADPGIRDRLFTRGSDITPYSEITLPGGQQGDAGIFTFGNGGHQQQSQQGGPIYTIHEFIKGIGAANNQSNLDKADQVRPLTDTEFNDLLGVTVCAVVYDSDVSYDEVDQYANLQGANLGLAAFTVTAVTPQGGSLHPNITVDLIPSSQIKELCEQGQINVAISDSTPGFYLVR